MGNINIGNKQFLCYWSGGKDSSLAYYHAAQNGGIPTALVTTLLENGERTRAHGLSVSMLKKQAEQLGSELFTCPTSWDDYEQNFVDLLSSIKGKNNIEHGVFGDIEIEEHREWVEKVCQQAGFQAHLPLWQKSRRELICEFIELGFKAVVIVVDSEKLDETFLGRTLDMTFIAEMERMEIDPAGENGEYHTVVVDGPIFAGAISYELGEIERENGKLFQDISPAAGG